MGGVKNHRIANIRHLRQAAHIRHQRVIAKGCPALGQQDMFIACLYSLGGNMFHIPWRKKLAFFDIDDSASCLPLPQQICLTA